MVIALTVCTRRWATTRTKGNGHSVPLTCVQPLKERMDRNPKTLLEEVFEDNNLTRLRVG
jgi:hypothetical protein